jgi:hypothetical protein
MALSGCGGTAPASDSPDDVATQAGSTMAAELSQPATSGAPMPAVPATTQATSVPPSPPPVPPVPPPPPHTSESLSLQAQKGPAGAQAVLRTWARALESRRFDVAWAQFGNPPASRAAFTKWWQRYRSIKVALGLGESDAAMGSLYYTAPATLTGTTVEGKPFRLQGDVVVRRVNDVDGATPAQLRWHIGTADLKDAAAP